MARVILGYRIYIHNLFNFLILPFVGDWHFISDVLSLTYTCLLLIHLSQIENETQNIILRYVAFSLNWIAKARDEWDSAFFEFIVILGFVIFFGYRAYQLYTFQKHKLSRISVQSGQIGFAAFISGSIFFLILERVGFTSSTRFGRIMHALAAGIVNLCSGIAMYHFWKCVPFHKSKDDDLNVYAWL
jgi:hypothetical protein